jgi:hypothetical protein
MIRLPVLRPLAAFVFLAAAGMARAQDEPPVVVSIVLRPSPAPVPALKYRILPERSTLVQGNAAIFYHRAIEKILGHRALRSSMPRSESRKPEVDTDEQAAFEWVSGPLAAIPLDRAHRWLDQHQYVLREAEFGARRQSCDWEFDARPEGFDLVIQEIQEMRSLARLVALRVRVAIREKKFDEAIDWLQTGFAMARHVSQGPTLIQSLVGIAACGNLNLAVEDLLQSPGAPSLFWALAERPHPFIDLAPALEGERFLLEKEIPRLRELDGVPWSVEQARAFGDELQTKMFRMVGMGYKAPSNSGSFGRNMSFGDWALKPAILVQAYPEAKRALIAQGRPAAVIEAMPTIQVAALYNFQTYQELRDDVFKWTCLPIYQANSGMDGAWRRHAAELHRRPLLKLFTMFLPAVQSSNLATARLDRQFDALQCIEAIRLHAATHPGFPSRLEDIIEAPVPIDPMTGQPFGYRVEGDRAILTAPYAPGAPRVPPYAIHYELKLAR